MYDTPLILNFDGKLLPDLEGFGKVNRLAVVAVQEKDNQLLCVTKTDDSTGKTEAEGKALEDWGHHLLQGKLYPPSRYPTAAAPMARLQTSHHGAS